MTKDKFHASASSFLKGSKEKEEAGSKVIALPTPAPAARMQPPAPRGPAPKAPFGMQPMYFATNIKPIAPNNLKPVSPAKPEEPPAE